MPAPLLLLDGFWILAWLEYNPPRFEVMVLSPQEQAEIDFHLEAQWHHARGELMPHPTTRQ